MAKRRRSKPPPRRARRSMLGVRPSLRLPRFHPEPHQLDVLALALIAVGIFLGGVAYLGWAGGPVGSGVVTALRFVLGVIGYAVPVALLVAGGLLLLRELRPPVRPMRTGSLCLVASLTLALAAGTLGVGPGAAPAHAYWHPAVLEARGGVVGAAEFWVASHLLSNLGADILAVFLFVAGIILLTGAGVAGTLRATGAGVARTGQAIRRSTEELTSITVARRPSSGPGRRATAAARTAAPAGYRGGPGSGRRGVRARARRAAAAPRARHVRGRGPGHPRRGAPDRR